MNNFTPRAQKVLWLAAKEANRLHHDRIGPEHLLLGVISLIQEWEKQYLPGTLIDLVSLKTAVEKEAGPGDPTNQFRKWPYTTPSKKVLALANREARSWGHAYVGFEHILLALLQFDNAASRVVQTLGPFILEKMELQLFGEEWRIRPQLPALSPLPKRPPQYSQKTRAVITAASSVIVAIVMFLFGIFDYLPHEQAKFLDQANRHLLIIGAKPH